MAQPVDGSLPTLSGREAVDLFIRSYETVLRSTGEVRVAGLLEPYLAMAPSLHPRARARVPDAAAITYVGLRLPSSMANVRLVLLGASLESMAARYRELERRTP